MRTGSLILGFVLFSLVPPAFGYQQMVSKNWGVPISQPTNSITMYVNMGCPSEDRCWNEIARGAIAEWNAVNSPFHIRAVVGAADIETACEKADGIHTMQWSAARCNGDAWGNTVGYAWLSINRRGDILESDIRVRHAPDKGKMWTASYFRHVVLHELGHVVGLGHPNEYNQEVEAVMNLGSSLSQLQLDDRNGIRGIYGEQLWDETPYPTELLGAWRLRHPETGELVRWTFTHLRWRDNTRWVLLSEPPRYGRGARVIDIWPDATLFETHYIILYRTTPGTECLSLTGLYEGPHRFTGQLYIGTDEDEDGLCTEWPESRQYDVEWWRESAP